MVGRQKASEAGFNYSAAMKAQKGNWTPEDLDKYLTNPKAMVPGTNMTFAGIPRGKERADLHRLPQQQVGQAGGSAQADRPGARPGTRLSAQMTKRHVTVIARRHRGRDISLRHRELMYGCGPAAGGQNTEKPT